MKAADPYPKCQIGPGCDRDSELLVNFGVIPVVMEGGKRVGIFRYCTVRNSQLNDAMICPNNRLDSSHPPAHDRSFHIAQGEMSNPITLFSWAGGEQLHDQIIYRARASARAPAAPAMPKAT